MLQILSNPPGKKNVAAPFRQEGAQCHAFAFDEIPKGVQNIIDQLLKAGYESYLVGGCVRDALLNLRPKDFDIATSARPEEIKQLFGKRACIIGKRFRIVHIYAKNQVVEITTFRSDSKDQEHKSTRQGQHGLILADNTFGTMKEDATRRDLSINALYYDTVTNEVVDFVNGYTDLQQGRIRLVGDPLTRFREDPARMLRCVRLAAKLGFTMPRNLHALIRQNASLLSEVSHWRMLGEFLKLNTHPSLESAIEQYRQTGMLKVLFPSSCRLLDGDCEIAQQGQTLLTNALRNTDERLRTKGRVSQFYLIAVLLWPLVRTCLDEEQVTQFAMHRAGKKALLDVHCMKIPKSFTARMFNVWTLQIRLQYPQASSVSWLMAHKDFRAACDFLCLRKAAGEIPASNPAEWWQKIQAAKAKERQTMIDSLPEMRKKESRRGLKLSRSLFEL